MVCKFKNKILKIKILFIIVPLFVIITILFFKSFADNLSFEFRTVTYANKEYHPMTDALAFHFSVIDYDAKDGESKEVSLHGPLIEVSNATMKGYGRYHMQLQFNLVGFIEYCHSKFPSVIEPILAPIQGDTYSAKITKLKSSVCSGITKQVLDSFWSTLSSGEAYNFDKLQDEFIIRSYIKPAIGKINLSNSRYKSAFGTDGSFSLDVDDATSDDGALITALLTTVYSDFNTADLTSSSSINIKAGDLVPFLYNVDETNYNAEEIAKFAYIAYINGFETAGRTDGFHYWEQEFEAVLPYESYDLTDEEIDRYQQKYDKMSDILSGEKGDKGSRLLGQTITTIIKGDYNIETQVSAVRAKINNILQGFEMDTTYKDLIAKNYTMVKHMMDNEHIKDTIKDYEVGTIFRNETSLSQGQADENNTNTALLSDFQMVTVAKKNLVLGRLWDTDGDFLLDGEELGPEPTSWTDITSIVIAALGVNGASNIPSSKALNWETFNDSIKVEWTDARKTTVNKVYAKLYNYKSNPNLKDTDFDGFSDFEEHNKLPLNNNFKGSTLITEDGDLSIDFNTDFRYLMHKDTKYNDELAQQSLIMSNLAEGRNIKLKQGTTDYGELNIRNYMSKLGFSSILSSADNSSGSVLKYNIGYKTIDYYGKKRGVVGIYLGGLNDENAYNKFVCTSENLSNHNNIYENISEIIKTKIDSNKINDFDDYDLKYCYYIAGKGIAGGVAGTLASKVKDTNNDVYCYTFSSPMTHMGSKTDQYSFIKNIINEDDYLVKVYGVNDNVGNAYHRLGDTYNASIMSNFIHEYRNLTRNNPKYTGDYQKVNSIINSVIELRRDHGSFIETINSDISKLLSKYIGRSSTSNDMQQTYDNINTQDLAVNIRNQVANNELKTASSTKAYWTLSKCLEGIDNQVTNGRKYTKTNEQVKHEIWSSDVTKHMHENIETIANWYIDNVPTYQAGKTRDSRADAFEGDRGLYTSDILQGFYDDETLSIDSYRTLDFDNSEYEFNNNPLMWGDDCTDFASAVFLYESNGSQKNAIEYRGNKESTKGTRRDPYAGFKLHERSASQFKTVESFENAMDRLGYEKIYTSDLNGASDLRPGDLLVCDSHVEFYIGYIYAHKWISRDIDEWISVDKLTNAYVEYDDYFDVNGVDKRTTNLYSTFGWGSVKSSYPSATNYFKLRGTKGNYYFNFTGDGRQYTVIYRRNP